MNEEHSSLSYVLSPGLRGQSASVVRPSYVAHVKHTGSLDEDALSEAVAKATGADVEYIRYIESVRRRELVKALRVGKRAYLDGFVLTAAIRGKFDTIDGTFDAERNSVVVTGYTYGALQECLKDVVPQNVVTGGRPTLSRILEAGQKADEILVTGQDVTITGRDLWPSMEAADEGVTLADVKTGVTKATAQLASSNLIEVVCSFATLPPAGRYLLVVSTRVGNGSEYKVKTASREVVVK